MRPAWLALLLTVLTALAQAQDRPNVVIMLGDNVGYGDIGAYGAGEMRGMPTLRIDGTSNWVIGQYLRVIGAYRKTLEQYRNPKAFSLTEFK